MARVIVSGSSGLIGKPLVAFLKQQGWQVQRLVRGRPAPPDGVYWNVEERQIDAEALAGVDAVVHLAGESLFGLWTSGKKQRILASRRDGTRFLAETLAKLQPPPRVLISASAVGYYGNRGDTPVTEEDASGEGFLAEVCREWEAATAPAREAGIRVTNLRLGLVASSRGGAFSPILRTVRLGLGAKFGDGRQYMSWIALPDLLRVIRHLLSLRLTEESLSGPVNAVAPQAITNADLVALTGRLLKRPAPWRLPAWLLRLAGGEMAEEMLLSGVRVAPRRLQESGFAFQYADAEAMMKDLIAGKF